MEAEVSPWQLFHWAFFGTGNPEAHGARAAQPQPWSALCACDLLLDQAAASEAAGAVKNHFQFHTRWIG